MTNVRAALRYQAISRRRERAEQKRREITDAAGTEARETEVTCYRYDKMVIAINR